jgi:large repetitive protein
VVDASPIVDAGLDRIVSIGESLTFNGSFTDAGKLDTHTIVWDFGDGTTANTLEATHTYTKDGSYTVKLSVSDNAGSTTSDTLLVLVNPLPTLVISDRTIVEGNGSTSNAIFTVSLSSPSTKPITVNYATFDGTATAGIDYTASSGTLTFAPGITSQTIIVAVIGDRIDEVDEIFSINLTGATNATITDAQGVGSITDDDDRRQ